MLDHIAENHIHQMFPNITKLLTILLTISATSPTLERAFSALCYVTTDFRSSMSEDDFNALILTYLHRDITLNYNNIIDMCTTKDPRRVFLKNLLIRIVHVLQVLIS